MDEIDQKILNRLQKNARVTLAELSKEIALSLPAISERIKKMETSGIIKQYTTLLSAHALNKNLMAFIFLRFDNPKHADAFAEQVKQKNNFEMNECYYITGNFDYILKVLTENTHSLEKILTKIKNVQGVVKTETLVVLATIKDDLSITPF